LESGRRLRLINISSDFLRHICAYRLYGKHDGTGREKNAIIKPLTGLTRIMEAGTEDKIQANA
jgi:hypothetical protein